MSSPKVNGKAASAVKPEASATVTPAVLALGLPLCATSSMQAALERLGFAPCLHMADVVPNRERSQMVISALHAALHEPDTEQRQGILHKLVSGFAGLSGFPGAMFADDLMDMYPDAPVILTQPGSVNAWHESVLESTSFFPRWLHALVDFPLTPDQLHFRMILETHKLCLNRWGLRLRDIKWHSVHTEWVKEEAEKRGRKVLEFREQDGWAPLCEFLGKHMPENEPFPHQDDRKEVAKLRRLFIFRALVYWVTILGFSFAIWSFAPQIASFSTRLLIAADRALQAWSGSSPRGSLVDCLS